jgi:hypothetical protein
VEEMLLIAGKFSRATKSTPKRASKSAMTATIYHRSMCTVLSLFEESTKELHYLGGLLTETTLSKPTLIGVLSRACEAGLLRERPELLPHENRPARKYYELTGYGLHVLRVMPRST